MTESSAVKVLQLAVGGLDGNFSYLATAPGGDAFIVDPCGDAALIRKAVREAGELKPKYILLTHGHNDHFDALKETLDFFKAPVAGHKLCKAPCDLRLDDGAELPFGGLSVKCVHTPGHSLDSVCYLLSDASALFTGDTLFIDCCGYCEPRSMFATMRQRLWPLPDEAIVYSGHDYGRVPFESLGAQKRSNPYLKAAGFEAFKSELKNL